LPGFCRIESGSSSGGTPLMCQKLAVAALINLYKIGKEFTHSQ
jgi:hypothetical protein